MPDDNPFEPPTDPAPGRSAKDADQRLFAVLSSAAALLLVIGLALDAITYVPPRSRMSIILERGAFLFAMLLFVAAVYIWRRSKSSPSP